MFGKILCQALLLLLLTSTTAMGASGSISRVGQDSSDIIEVPYGTTSVPITIRYSVSGDTEPNGIKDCCWQDCIDLAPGYYTGRASVSPKDDNGSYADIHLSIDGVKQGWYAGVGDGVYTSTIGVNVSNFEPNSVHTVTFYFQDFYTAYCYSVEYGGYWRGP